MHMNSSPPLKTKQKYEGQTCTVGGRQQIGISLEEKCWLMCQFTAGFGEERSEREHNDS